jgi:hypothetical protein
MFALRFLSRITDRQSQSEVQIFVPRSAEIDWPRSKAFPGGKGLPVETTLPAVRVGQFKLFTLYQHAATHRIEKLVKT